MINDISKINLKGKVKSASETVFKAFHDNIEIRSDEIISKNNIQYNEYGNIIECNVYKPDSSLKTRETYNYDKNGKLLEKKIFKKLLSSNLLLDSIETFIYDYKGNLVEKEFSGSKVHLDYKHDVNGNLVEERYFDDDDKLYYINTFKYDENNNLIVDNYYSLSYDNRHYNISGKTIYKYGNNGKMIKESHYNGIYQNDNSKYHLDECYRRIQDDWIPIDHRVYPKSINKYKYNDKGDKIEMFSYYRYIKNTYTCIYNYYYEYDAIGNWIKKFDFDNDYCKNIIKREIEYY